jgi:hypothetical protein
MRVLLRLARGRRLYSIWSWKDPLPSLVYWTSRYVPDLIGAIARAAGTGARKKLFGHSSRSKELRLEARSEKP